MLLSSILTIVLATVAVPVWQVILVRMSVTWVGCIICTLSNLPSNPSADSIPFTDMHYANIEHPFLGPPGVRLLLCARGFVGFGGLFGVYYSLRYLSLSDATVLTFLAPVLVGSFIIRSVYSVFLGGGD